MALERQRVKWRLRVEKGRFRRVRFRRADFFWWVRDQEEKRDLVRWVVWVRVIWEWSFWDRNFWSEFLVVFRFWFLTLWSRFLSVWKDSSWSLRDSRSRFRESLRSLFSRRMCKVEASFRLWLKT